MRLFNSNSTYLLIIEIRCTSQNKVEDNLLKEAIDKMATRQSIEQCIQNCEEALQLAQEQYTEASKQEHYNDEHYIQSQQLLQTAYNELEHMAHSSNEQQRAQLNRVKMQIEQLQHEMILLRH